MVRIIRPVPNSLVGFGSGSYSSSHACESGDWRHISNLTWAAHIDKTTAKGNRQLGFLKRNLPINCAKVKETAYKGFRDALRKWKKGANSPPHLAKGGQLLRVRAKGRMRVLNASAESECWMRVPKARSPTRGVRGHAPPEKFWEKGA